MRQHFVGINEGKNTVKELKEWLQKPEMNLNLPLNSWRVRLPNKAESFSVWRELLECRNYMFSQLKAKLGGIPNFARIESCTQDIPWNLLKLAQVARKHNLVDKELKNLNEADKSLRELNEAND